MILAILFFAIVWSVGLFGFLLGWFVRGRLAPVMILVDDDEHLAGVRMQDTYGG